LDPKETVLGELTSSHMGLLLARLKVLAQYRRFSAHAFDAVVKGRWRHTLILSIAETFYVSSLDRSCFHFDKQ
jgi:hypothetical protein